MTTTIGAIQNTTCEGTLTLGGVNLNTQGWTVKELWRLWGGQRDYRGTDRLIPFVDGVLSYPRWLNGLRLSLPMIITGFVNSSGATYANSMQGLQTNLATINAVAQAPDPLTTNGTRTISLLTPLGTTLTGTVIPLGLVPGAVTTYIMKATLELLIPAGKLT